MSDMAEENVSDIAGVFCRDIFGDNQCTTLRITKIVFAIAAIICSIFLIFVMWLFNKLKTFFFNILLYIALCNIMQTISIIIPIGNYRGPNVWCTLQGLMLQFFTWTIICWELGLTIHLYAKTFYTDGADHQRIYHAACWGASALFTIIPLIPLKYGPAVTWCWIVDPNWQFAMFYAEYIMIFILVFALYVRIVYKVFSEKPKTADDVRRLAQWRRKVRPMILYPCVIILEGIIPLSFRFRSFIRADEDPSFAFTVIFAVVVSFWGVMFVAVYTLDPVTRSELLLIRAKCREKWASRGIQSGLPVGLPQPSATPPTVGDTGTIQNDPDSVSTVSIDPSTDGNGEDNQTATMETTMETVTTGKYDVSDEMAGTDNNN